MTAKSSFDVNDFVVRFANVNGSGSASANQMIAKAIFRMGVPIGPKNMFPSNIQGLPTWFEIRVNEKGFAGRRSGVDLMMAFNQSTFDKDQKEVCLGGYFLYDSTKPLREDQKREGIHYLDFPMSAIASKQISASKQKTLLQNMLYVGAISSLLAIDKEVILQLIREQYGKKPALVTINAQVFEIGFDYAQKHFPRPLPFYVRLSNQTKGKILLDGNKALALGAIYAGATIAAWYPITPSTSVIENFENYCRLFRRDENGFKNYAILQAEDEIAACGMVLGASWNGARAFTATSGPGISLMNEFLGYAYYAELPLVIFNVQRNGPSTGMPTRSQQSDLLLCAHASHGDTCHIMLFPDGPKSCFEMALDAFDLAERFQTPVFVMSDLEIGMNEFMEDSLDWLKDRVWDRGKVLDENALAKRDKPFYRYDDEDGDGVCFRTYPGVHSKGAYFTRGSGHDRLGRYTEDTFLYQENLDRIAKKWALLADHLPKPIFSLSSELADKETSKALVAYFGSSVQAAKEAIALLKEEGIFLDEVLIRSFPFAKNFLDKLCLYKKIYLIEQNQQGQMARLFYQTGVFYPGQIVSLCFYDGLPLVAFEVKKRLNLELAAL